MTVRGYKRMSLWRKLGDKNSTCLPQCVCVFVSVHTWLCMGAFAEVHLHVNVDIVTCYTYHMHLAKSASVCVRACQPSKGSLTNSITIDVCVCVHLVRGDLWSYRTIPAWLPKKSAIHAGERGGGVIKGWICSKKLYLNVSLPLPTYLPTTHTHTSLWPENGKKRREGPHKPSPKTMEFIFTFSHLAEALIQSILRPHTHTPPLTWNSVAVMSVL